MNSRPRLLIGVAAICLILAVGIATSLAFSRGSPDADAKSSGDDASALTDPEPPTNDGPVLEWRDEGHVPFNVTTAVWTGQRYVVFGEEPGPTGAPRHAVIYRSVDGTAWEKVEWRFNFDADLWADNGTIVAWSNTGTQDMGTFVVMRSDDHGRTFTTPYQFELPADSEGSLTETKSVVGIVASGPELYAAVQHGIDVSISIHRFTLGSDGRDLKVVGQWEGGQGGPFMATKNEDSMTFTMPILQRQTVTGEKLPDFEADSLLVQSNNGEHWRETRMTGGTGYVSPGPNGSLISDRMTLSSQLISSSDSGQTWTARGTEARHYLESGPAGVLAGWGLAFELDRTEYSVVKDRYRLDVTPMRVALRHLDEERQLFDIAIADGPHDFLVETNPTGPSRPWNLTVHNPETNEIAMVLTRDDLVESGMSLNFDTGSRNLGWSAAGSTAWGWEAYQSAFGEIGRNQVPVFVVGDDKVLAFVRSDDQVSSDRVFIADVGQESVGS